MSHINPFLNEIGTSPNTAIVFRDAVYNVLTTLSGFASIEKNPIKPVKDEDLPAIRIYLKTERMSSEGQWNQDEPHFVHTPTLWISVLLPGTSAPVLDGSVVLMAETIKSLILSGYVTTEQDDTIDDGPYRHVINYSEGIENFNVDYLYPLDGQSSICEIRMQIDFKLRSSWHPMVPDDFLEIDIKTQMSDTETLGAAPGTWPLPLERDYILPQNGIATLVMPQPNPNAGNGTLINIMLGPQVVNGNYVVKMIDPSNYVCYRPPYSVQFVPDPQEITFTFVGGSVPMAPGDRFNITVTGAAQ